MFMNSIYPDPTRLRGADLRNIALPCLSDAWWDTADLTGAFGTGGGRVQTVQRGTRRNPNGPFITFTTDYRRAWIIAATDTEALKTSCEVATTLAKHCKTGAPVVRFEKAVGG